MVLKTINTASRRKQQIWPFLRIFIPHRIRWFYEGCRQIPGQMWYADRKLLYQTIRKYKPEVVFEVGTWLGGGSTYFIAQALFENGFGTLYTIETETQVYQSAVENYDKFLPHLKPYVCFKHGKSTQVYPPVLDKLGKIDGLFLDGAEDAFQTVNEFKLFSPYLKKDSVLMAHDWDTEKMRLLRPIIQSSPYWEIERQLTAPISVGFAVSRKII